MTEPRISMILAVARNGVIGRGTELPWHIPTDLKHFKRLTTDHTVIVGRKTHEDIVARLGHPLPNRRTVMVSRTTAIPTQPVFHVADLHQALEQARRYEATVIDPEVFVIGGATLYRAAVPYVTRVYCTRVQAEVDGDIVFPDEAWIQDFDQAGFFEPSQGSTDEYPIILERYERRRAS